MKATDAVVLEYKLRALLADPRRLAAMREQMRRHAKPRAAAAVLDHVSRAWHGAGA